MRFQATPLPAHRAIVQRLYRWVLAATVLGLCVVALGAYTRLVDAGLGCPDWPGCYGYLVVPHTAEHLAVAEARFPDTPVEAHKGWPEMIHRYFASTLGLLILIVAYLSVRHRHEGVPVKLPLFLAGFVMLQGAFGAWTVTLKLWPQVVSLHLLGGFTTVSLLFLLGRRLRVQLQHRRALAVASLVPVARWTRLALVAVILQIALGAWTASNYAALACPDLPTCQGELWPPMDFRDGLDIAQHVGPNYLGGRLDNDSRVAIHVSHRLGALLVLGVLGATLVVVWRRSGSAAAVRRAVGITAALLLAQLSLGVVNVLWLIPLPIAVAHNGVGLLLLMATVNLCWQVHRVTKRLAQEAALVAAPVMN